MARVNIDTLWISELKWTGKGEFNSDDHYTYYCQQEFLRRDGVALIANKTIQTAVLGCSLKNDRTISGLFPGQIIHYHSNPSLCPNPWWQRSWSRPVLWRSTRPSRTNPKKKMSFSSRGLECKSRKSRDPWGNRQVWPWSTKWSRANANRVLPREHSGHSKHRPETRQETTLHMDIIKWSIMKSDWL